MDKVLVDLVNKFCIIRSTDVVNKQSWLSDLLKLLIKGMSFQEPQFQNKIIGENDITLQCVDQLYGGRLANLLQLNDH